MLALLLSLIMWHPGAHPEIYACYPGKTPASPAPSNCERIPYQLMIWKVR